MFAKSVEDEKALHTANKTVMIPLLNIKRTMMCKKIAFMPLAARTKD